MRHKRRPSEWACLSNLVRRYLDADWLLIEDNIYGILPFTTKNVANRKS